MRLFTAIAGLAGAAVLLAAAPAMAGVRSATENRFEVANSVRIAAAPETVWRALVAPGRWWSSEHTWSGDARNMSLAAEAGGCFCERLPDVGGSVEHGHVILARPGRELRMMGNLGPLQAQAVIGNLLFVLTPRDGGTDVTMSYIVAGAIEGGGTKLAPLVDGVLAAQLVGLKRLAEAPSQ